MPVVGPLLTSLSKVLNPPISPETRTPLYLKALPFVGSHQAVRLLTRPALIVHF